MTRKLLLLLVVCLFLFTFVELSTSVRSRTPPPSDPSSVKPVDTSTPPQESPKVPNKGGPPSGGGNPKGEEQTPPKGGSEAPKASDKAALKEFSLGLFKIDLSELIASAKDKMSEVLSKVKPVSDKWAEKFGQVTVENLVEQAGKSGKSEHFSKSVECLKKEGCSTEFQMLLAKEVSNGDKDLSLKPEDLAKVKDEDFAEEDMFGEKEKGTEQTNEEIEKLSKDAVFLEKQSQSRRHDKYEISFIEDTVHETPSAEDVYSLSGNVLIYLFLEPASMCKKFLDDVGKAIGKEGDAFKFKMLKSSAMALEVPEAKLADLAKVEGVVYVDRILPIQKITPAVYLFSVDKNVKPEEAVPRWNLFKDKDGKLVLRIVILDSTTKEVKKKIVDTATEKGVTAVLDEDSGNIMVHVAATQEDVNKVAAWFALNEDVKAIEFKVMRKISVVRRTSQQHLGSLQMLRNELENFEGASFVQSQTIGTRSSRAKGLTGKNIIIGVGDTGLDYEHCFFNAPNNKPKEVTKCTVAAPCTTDDKWNEIMGAAETWNKDKKVLKYWCYSDNHDTPLGHGTHVAGSAAGKDVLTNFDKMSGTAPESNIVFTDLGDDTGALSIPKLKRYFEWNLKSGAHLNTNSWGTSTFSYQDDTKKIDKFIFENDKLTVLFAATNQGYKQVNRGFSTISLEPHAKNVISVGNVDLWRSRDFSGARQIARTQEQAKTNWELLKILACDVAKCKNYFSAVASIEDKCKQMAGEGGGVNKPDSMCTKLGTINAADLQKTHCKWLAKARDDTVVGIVFTDKTRDHALFTDTFMTKNAHCHEETLKVIIHPANERTVGEWVMNWSTSKGPTTDWRIKPDVAAPGSYIFSPGAGLGHAKKGEGACVASKGLLTQMSGTSMATPIAAGASALITEYFLKKVDWCREIKCASAKWKTDISSTLIKAALIHSTDKDNLVGKYWYDSGAGYSIAPFNLLDGTSGGPFVLGRGMIKLDNLFHWKADEKKILYTVTKTMAKKDVPTDVRKDEYKFCVKDTAVPFRATLVWHDEDGDNLILDLDLKVIKADTTHVWGNSQYKLQDFVPASVGMVGVNPYTADEDRINNVEEVWFTPAAAGEVKVEVIGFSLAKDVKYSLVVSYGTDDAKKYVPADTCCDNDPNPGFLSTGAC